MKYIKLQCPNQPKADDSFVCNGQMGGIDKDTLLLHDFENGPFEHLAYCDKCGIFWNTKIIDLMSPVEMTSSNQGERIKMERAVDIFPYISVNGRRIKNAK